MARIFVFTHLAGPVIASPMGVYLYLVSPTVTPELLVIVVGIVSFWALPFILRATGNMTLVMSLSFQGLTFVSLVGIFFYGGFSSPFLPWVSISLMLGLFYLSKNLKLVIAVFCANLAVFLASVFVFGLPDGISAEQLSLLGWLSIVSAAIYMTWMALYYSRMVALRTELEVEADRFRSTIDGLEQAKRIAEKVNQDRSLFFAKMSHELRTPLNVIIGYSDILIEDCADNADMPKQTEQDLSRINAAGKHLLSLVSQALDPDRTERGEMLINNQTFALGALCDDVAATILPMVEKNGNSLVIDCPIRHETVNTDRTKLAQILINLLGNAGKFTRNGTITLSLRIEKSIADDRLIATVADNGIGIAPEALPRLFEAYVQADASIKKRFGGTGMGLAITRKFCALLGGDIRVQSEAGKGSVFIIDIPAGSAKFDTEPDAVPRAA